LLRKYIETRPPYREWSVVLAFSQQQFYRTAWLRCFQVHLLTRARTALLGSFTLHLLPALTAGAKLPLKIGLEYRCYRKSLKSLYAEARHGNAQAQKSPYVLLLSPQLACTLPLSISCYIHPIESMPHESATKEHIRILKDWRVLPLQEQKECAALLPCIWPSGAYPQVRTFRPVCRLHCCASLLLRPTDSWCILPPSAPALLDSDRQQLMHQGISALVITHHLQATQQTLMFERFNDSIGVGSLQHLKVPSHI
jgi:hypothetical protein